MILIKGFRDSIKIPFIYFFLMDLYLLSQKWKDLVEQARSKQLQPQESFTLSNLGIFGVDRFDAILPPGHIPLLLVTISHLLRVCLDWFYGAIMAVGASKLTGVADKDGFFNVKSKILVI
ncbi:hypothetical protein UlMin_030911 [Ulmus minor]